ncbi:MAG TPA: MerR family transcriptional regulator [Abditibacteriaceae bacterium]|nr:MerR family transcriptional regulator [Abditibacteriaceae bacterium]
MPTSNPQYTMRAVVRRTGLTPDVIRVWEKRYNVVAPQRTASGQRVYAEADVERLQLLRRATLLGHGISRIANLPVERLRELLAREDVALPEAASEAEKAFFAQPYLEKCLAAVERFDAEELENTLSRAMVHLGQPAIMDCVLEPLMNRIDKLWESGALRIAQEHLASAIIHVFLSSLARHMNSEPEAPALIATTPARQLHEIGALMVAATAAHQGWKVTYLGPNLPAEEIALAAERNSAAAVALSIVYPLDDSALPDDLIKLGELLKLLPSRPALLVGGRAATSYEVALGAIGAIRIEDMQTLRLKLETLLTAGAEEAS